MNSIAVYTCIFGNYDTLKPVLNASHKVDYICFTDNENLKSDGVWQIRKIPPDDIYTANLPEVKKQRIIKILPNIYLSEYDISIWIDGSIQIVGNILFEFLNDLDFENKFMYVNRHPSRDCIYREEIEIIRQKKDIATNTNPQIYRYKREGFPEHFGLAETGIIARKHNDFRCKKLMFDWAKEIINGSHRDQLSFDYCRWKNGMSEYVGWIETNLYYTSSSSCFRIYSHGQHPSKLVKFNKIFNNVNAQKLKINKQKPDESSKIEELKEEKEEKEEQNTALDQEKIHNQDQQLEETKVKIEQILQEVEDEKQKIIEEQKKKIQEIQDNKNNEIKIINEKQKENEDRLNKQISIIESKLELEKLQSNAIINSLNKKLLNAIDQLKAIDEFNEKFEELNKKYDLEKINAEKIANKFNSDKAELLKIIENLKSKIDAKQIEQSKNEFEIQKEKEEAYQKKLEEFEEHLKKEKEQHEKEKLENKEEQRLEEEKKKINQILQGVKEEKELLLEEYKKKEEAYQKKLEKFEEQLKKEKERISSNAVNKNTKLKTNVGCIYTCITGEYDALKPLPVVPNGWDLICFTDNTNIPTFNQWKLRPIPHELRYLSNTKTQRFVKILPHRFLKEYDVSLWVDANIEIAQNLTNFFNDYDLNKNFIYIGKHPARKCIYDEANVCLEKGKETKENIEKVVNILKAEGYPKANGLVESGIILRKHNDPNCIKLMELWAEKIINLSKRDQLSFNYCCWKLGLKYGEFDQKIMRKTTAPFFRIRCHKKTAIHEKPFVIAACNYNTTRLTNVWLKSILKHCKQDNIRIIIFDNSDVEPFTTDIVDDRIRILDNTKGKIIDYNKEIKEHGAPTSHVMWANLRHSIAIQWMLDNLDTDDMVLFDSDTILKVPITSDFIDSVYITKADIQKEDRNYPCRPLGKRIVRYGRFMPFIQYFNLKLIKYTGIRYFDDSRIISGKNDNTFSWDTGAAFYADVVNMQYPYKILQHTAYVQHLQGASWAKVYSEDQFIEDNKIYWD